MTITKTDWLKNIPIAHRGLHSGNNSIPENSLAAFKEAINNKYPIELDVHLLADDRLAVFHDDTLERMCGKNIEIQNLTSTELHDYKLLTSNEKIPLLEEVFDLVKGQVPILIEIKNQKRNKEIQKVLLSAILSYKGAVAIQSFNPFLLKSFIKNAPAIPRGQLSSSFKGEKMNLIIKKLLRSYLLNFISKPDFIAHDFEDIPNRKVKKLRAKGRIVLCWTIREKASYEQVLPFCDNIIFEGFIP